MLARWIVPVVGVRAGSVARDHAHAVVSSWLDEDDHHASIKPWRSSTVAGPDGITLMEVCTLTEETGRRMFGATGAGRAIRFGARSGVIADDPRIVEIHEPSTEGGDVPNAWCVSFRTPATVRDGSQTYPLFEPHRLMRSLTTKWNALLGSTVGCINSPAAWSTLRVTDIDGHTEVERAAKLVISGFVGRVRYTTDDPAAAAVTQQLLSFARFAGVGSYTTRGFGDIQLEPTWHLSRSARAATTTRDKRLEVQ